MFNARGHAPLSEIVIFSIRLKFYCHNKVFQGLNQPYLYGYFCNLNYY